MYSALYLQTSCDDYRTWRNEMAEQHSDFEAMFRGRSQDQMKSFINVDRSQLNPPQGK